MLILDGRIHGRLDAVTDTLHLTKAKSESEDESRAALHAWAVQLVDLAGALARQQGTCTCSRMHTHTASQAPLGPSASTRS